MSLSTIELEDFVAGLVASREIWDELVEHSDSARIYSRIWDDEDVNAWLICWSEDDDTGFHDHDGSAAAIQVIAGHVREDRLCLSGPPRGRVIGPGERLSLPANAIHRVLHAGSGPAVTIHAYSPPLRRTGSFTVAGDGTLQRTPQTYETELRAEAGLSS